MIDGIKIYTKLPLQDHLSISQGTEMVDMLNGKPTVAPTFVPREPWRPLNNDQLQLVRGQANPPAYQSIGLFRLPRAVKERCIKQALRKLLPSRIFRPSPCIPFIAKQ